MRVIAAPRGALRVASSRSNCFPRWAVNLILFLTPVALAAPLADSQQLRFSPRLRAGQTLVYRIDFSSSRKMQTDSSVTTPPLPSAESVNGTALLQIEVVSADAVGFHLKTYYSERETGTAAALSSPTGSSTASGADKVIEVTIGPDGAASLLKGFDQLSPTQQFAWNDWLGRFTASMTRAKGAVHRGQKWESSEPETAPSPIAGLAWNNRSQYVRDERCPDSAGSSKPEGPSPASGSCAVLFVRSTLRQKTSPKNSTPEDYKLRNLKTHGVASGANETILYMSLATRLLVRSTEDAQQSMDVFVELADGSNQVHYTLDAKSHSEILLLSD